MKNLTCCPPREVVNCLEAMAALQAYVDREVDEATANRLDRHLEACRRCGLRVAVYREIKRALHDEVAVAEDSLRRLEEFTRGFADGDGSSGAVVPTDP
jgi:predicted anti-sigma-YlaC factor YlaD